MILEAQLAALAVAIAGVAVGATIFGAIARRKQVERDRGEAATLDAQSVALLDDATSMEYFLRERLGSIKVSSYFRDSAVNEQVNAVLDEIRTTSAAELHALPSPKVLRVGVTPQGRWEVSDEEAKVTEVFKTMHEAIAAARKSVTTHPSAQIQIQDSVGRKVIDPVRKGQRTPTFEIYRDRRGEYRFRLKDVTGRVLLVSEGFVTKEAALNTVRQAQEIIRTAELSNLTVK